MGRALLVTKKEESGGVGRPEQVCCLSTHGSRPRHLDWLLADFTNNPHLSITQTNWKDVLAKKENSVRTGCSLGRRGVISLYPELGAAS